MKGKRLLILALILAPSLVLLGAALSEIMDGRERWRAVRRRITALDRQDVGDGY